MILVAGGTGTLGTQLVLRLSDRGLPVRVLTRDPATAAALPGSVEISTGDLRDPAAVAAAVRGCTTVISAVHGFAGPRKPSPEAIDRDANLALIQPAAAAGVQHLVLVSVLGAAPDHPDVAAPRQARRRADAARQRPGLGDPAARRLPGDLDRHHRRQARQQRPSPGLRPRAQPHQPRLRHDVAAVDLAVHDPSLRGQTLDVTGPENLTFTQLAERLITVGGKPGRIGTSRCRCCAPWRCWHGRSRRCSLARPWPRSS